MYCRLLPVSRKLLLMSMREVMQTSGVYRDTKSFAIFFFVLHCVPFLAHCQFFSPSTIKSTKMVNMKLLEELMTGDDSKIVTFRFKPEVDNVYQRYVEGTEDMKRERYIRVPKALLVKESEVFQTMFNCNWDRKVVDVDDPFVPFD